MPLINFNYGDLCSLLGEDVPKDILIEKIPLMGADMHDTEGDSDDMSVEFFPDRPDLFSVEGLARSLRSFLGLRPGMMEYDVGGSKIEVTVDPSVNDVRPYILCASVMDVDINDEILRSLMEMQEKLHLTIGRKRSKIAIGIHDLDKVTAPFTYKAVEPKSISFVPLAKTERMDMEEILKKHEKGKEYAHLLKNMKKYPIIVDSKDQVLSFPPIINGALTTVSTKTKNLFIDVTGTDLKIVKGGLDLVATALAERGGKIRSVKMKNSPYPVSPDLTPSKWKISIKECEKFAGITIGKKEMIEALEKMGMNAIAKGDDLAVTVPATRLDMMHPIDIFEDVTIGYGFERFGGQHELTQTNGLVSDSTFISETLRDVAIGLGFTEVTTLTLSSEKDEFALSGLPEQAVVRVLNPITEDHTCLRSSLLPSLMRILRRNRHRDLPQSIFEVGDVVRNTRKERRLCMLSASSKASFTESKSVAEAVLREMNVDYELRPCNYDTFIKGRGAEIISDGKQIGYFGEMDPMIIVGFEIEHPIIMFELSLSDMIEKAQRSIF